MIILKAKIQVKLQDPEWRHFLLNDVEIASIMFFESIWTLWEDGESCAVGCRLILLFSTQ